MIDSAHTSDRAELSALLATSCRVLGKLDMTTGSEGHVSYRLDGDTMLIRGKGAAQLGVRYTPTSDVIEVDFAAERVGEARDGIRPPSETFLHAWLYRLNPEWRCIVHVHPEAAQLLTTCGKEILPFHGRQGQGALLAVDGVPTYPRAITIHDDGLGEDFARFMGKKKAALMFGHGVTVVGTSIEDASLRAVQLNHLVNYTYRAYVLGNPRPIPDEDIAWLASGETHAETRSRGRAGGDAGMLADWAYYCHLTGEAQVPA